MTQLAVAPTQLSYAAGRIRGLYEAGKIERRVLSGPRIYEPGRAPSIEFRNVSFTYPGASRPSLVNVSFIVGAGEACTIVGHNASGKTTLCKLLARLWDPDSGVILLDGVDTREYDPSSLQRAIGLHLQDPPRFPLSIAESIALGNVHVAPDADAIRRAARLAGAEAYIDSLPRGFASSLDKPQLGSGNARSNRRGADMPAFMAHGREDQERWLEMSGGQKSKLALAGFMTRLETSDILVR